MHHLNQALSKILSELEMNYKTYSLISQNPYVKISWEEKIELKDINRISK